MALKVKGLLCILSVFLTAFSLNNTDTKECINADNLRSLRESAPPAQMKIINYDNSSRYRSMIESGVLITYKNRNAQNGRIAGDFSNWKLCDMERNSHGVWYYFITQDNTASDIPQKIRYKLYIDGFWVTDPKNPDKEDDGMGYYVSLVYPEAENEGKHLTYRFIEKDFVEFRLYKPGAKHISLVGDFNNWNPENDYLEKGSDNIWRLQKKLAKGTYRYNYIIDGEWVYDFYNDNSSSDGTGGISSLIQID